MSETNAAVHIPEWDLADRMRKALRESNVGVQEMADYLGVGRNTVSTWINGRITPSTQTVRLWALRCGVPYEWLAGELRPEVALARKKACAEFKWSPPLRKSRPLRIVPLPAASGSSTLRPIWYAS